MPPNKAQALVFHHLLCTVIKLFIVICHDFSIHFFKRGNAQKGLLAHLAALFLLFLVFEFFSFGPPLETMKKNVV